MFVYKIKENLGSTKPWDTAVIIKQLTEVDGGVKNVKPAALPQL